MARPEAATSIDSRTMAQRKRMEGQESMRARLAAMGHHDQATSLIQKIVNLAPRINRNNHAVYNAKILAYRAAAELHLKLLNKYLPDLRSIETTVRHDVRSAAAVGQELAEFIDAVRGGDPRTVIEMHSGGSSPLGLPAPGVPGSSQSELD